MSGPSVGYATLQIIPSLDGMSSKINQQLGAMMPGLGSRSGQQLGAGMEAGFSSSVRRMGEVGAKAIATATTAAAVAGGVALTRSLSAGWDRLTTIQDSTAALTISLGDAAAAGSLLGDVLDVVRGTPFALDQFSQAAQQLSGFGVDAQKIPGYLTAIGEAAATQGARAGEYASRLSTVFGQIAASGQVQLQDVWRISDTGVNALAILANSFGVTRDEMKDMISSGAVPAAEALDMLADGILNGTDGAAGATVALAGTMEELGTTLSGARANMDAAFSRFGASILAPFTPALAATFGSVTESLDLLGERAGKMLAGFADTESFARFVGMLEGAPEALSDMIDSLGNIAPASAGALAGVVAFGSGSSTILGRLLPSVSPIPAALAAIALATPEARAALADLAGDLAPLIGDMTDRLYPILVDLSDIAARTLPVAINTLGQAMTSATSIALPLLDIVADLTGFLADNTTAIVAAGAAWLAYQGVLKGTAAWQAAAAAVSAVTTQVTYLRGAITSIAATQGVSQASAALGVLGASFSASVSGAAVAGGAIAGVAAGWALATASLERSARNGQRAAREFMDSLDVDPQNVTSMREALADISTELAELAEQADGGRWERFKQRINPWDPNEIDEARAASNELTAEAEKLYETTMQLYALGSRMGLDESGINAWAERLDLDPARQSVLDMAAAIDGARASAERGTPQTDSLIEAFGTLADETANSTDKLNAWKDALDVALSPQLSIFDATTRVADRVAKLQETLTEGGWGLFDTGTEKGRANRDAIADAIRSAQDLANAYADIGNTDEAARVLAEVRTKILDAGSAAGFSRDRVNELLVELGLTPELIVTQFRLDDEEAQRRLDDLQAQLGALDGKQLEVKIRAQAIWEQGSLPNLDALAAAGNRLGGIYEFASGGVTPAHIAHGTRYKWAEPETGGEAFIPRLGDRNRSERILSHVADWFGGQYLPGSQPMREGGVVGGGRRRTRLPRSTPRDVTVIAQGASPREVSDDLMWSTR